MSAIGEAALGLAREPSITGTSEGPSATQVVATGIVLGAVAVAASVGVLPLSLVDVIVLVGVAAVLPLALPGRWWWSLAAGAAGVSLLLPVGVVAAVLVLPWAAVGLVAVWDLLPTGHRWRFPHELDLPAAGVVVAAGWSVVAALAFSSSRLGLRLAGIGEPIVELTAVHYTYAGTAALVLAARFLPSTDGAWHRVAQVATVVTAAAPAVVATGFVLHRAVPQVGGAVLMAVGVYLTATLELRAAGDRGRSLAARALVGLSGLAVWMPMVLAVAWASGQHWDVPALSVPDMARTHGVANALTFVLCGLLSAWLAGLAGAGADQTTSDPVSSSVGRRRRWRALRAG